MSAIESYDCVVIGGGPAGATAGALLAGFGHRVLILEKARFPRHHIGESLMPETYWTFKRLGVLDKLKASPFPKKESVQFVSASGKESQPFYFTDRNPHECSVTWQVNRDEFDRMMLDNAREHGAEVWENSLVKRVLFDGDRAVGVLIDREGSTVEVPAKVVIDASGQSAIIANQLKLRQGDSFLKNGAIYAYYKNAKRDEGRNSGATIIIHTPDRSGWFWFIPLPDDVASIGLVALPSYLFTGRGDDPMKTLRAEIENCPAMLRRLNEAELVSQAYVTSDFSYRADRVAGDGWVLIGDAFGFLDPVYSSGVFLALKSGEFAADAIHDALQKVDVSANRLGVFGPKLADGMGLLRKLVYAFYAKDFSFAEFLKAHPEHTDHLVRLLIGDVFNDEVGGMFDTMGRWIQLPDSIDLSEANPTAAPS
jgi:flavin-dependent dehydrogenase